MAKRCGENGMDFDRTASQSEARWVTSSFCGTGGCVQVRRAEQVEVRHSGADEPPMTFTRDEWRAFVAGVKAGEFDV